MDTKITNEIKAFLNFDMETYKTYKVTFINTFINVPGKYYIHIVIHTYIHIWKTEQNKNTV